MSAHERYPGGPPCPCGDDELGHDHGVFALGWEEGYQAGLREGHKLGLGEGRGSGSASAISALGDVCLALQSLPWPARQQALNRIRRLARDLEERA